MKSYLGYTILFAGDFAPVGWAMCDGSLLPIALNRELFNVIGNKYGGNGETNFALPDLRGKAIIGAGKSKLPASTVFELGATGGTERVRLTPAMFPTHRHSLSIAIKPKAAATPNTHYPEGAEYASGTNNLYSFGEPDVFMPPYDATVATTETGNNRNSVTVTILHPVLTLNYIICISPYLL
jgi:microcystin-dependent protein